MNARQIVLLLLLVLGCAPKMTDPRAASCLEQAAKALHSGAFLSGLAHADSARRLAPKSPDAHFLRGRLLFEMGYMEKAREAYKAALDLQRDYEGAWHTVGNIAFQLRQYPQALACYRHEASLRNAPMPWHGMGGTFVALGLAESARWAYQKAMAADPGYAPVYAGLADLHQTDGAYEEALRYARLASTLSPENVDFRYKVGAYLVRTGDYEGAATHLRPITESHPWKYGALFNLGRALGHLGRQEESERFLAQAEQARAEQAVVEMQGRRVRNVPTDFSARISFAQALRQSGRFAEALRAYDVALSLRPNNLALRNNVATLYLERGDTTEALSRYYHVLQQDSTIVMPTPSSIILLRFLSESIFMSTNVASASHAFATTSVKTAAMLL